MLMKKNIILSAFLLLFVFSAKGQGIITTIAGIGTQSFSGDSGLAINAGLYAPYSVVLDGLGNYYIADGYNNRIRKVDAAGIITTIAGTGIPGYNGDNILATDAEIYRPNGMCFDHSGNLYFADPYNNRIRKINISTGIITTVAGNGDAGYNGDNIPADSAQLDDPHNIVFDSIGNLYITDFGNSRIRKVNTSGIITTIAGTGTAGYTGDNGAAIAAEINTPYGIVVENYNIYFSDIYENVIRKIDAGGVITTIAGNGFGGFGGDNGMAVDSARFDSPTGLAMDVSHNLYIADALNSRIRKIETTTGIITTVAGGVGNTYSGDNGPAISAGLCDPTGIAIDAANNFYIADFGDNRIRFVSSVENVNNIINIQGGLTLYPNPSNGSITINVVSETEDVAQITITSILGADVKDFIMETNKPMAIQMEEPDGVYIFSAITNQGICSKIVILRK